MILLDTNIEAALRDSANTIVSISVSGGKDSETVAFETNDYLDSIGFYGERILVHSDLGLIEHSDSKPACIRLSERLQIPLHIIKPSREMIERWAYRWLCNVRRFVNLETVRISTPFSSQSARFCTSELKTAPICSFLKQQFRGKTILNVVGLRGQESRRRAKKPISEFNKQLYVKTHGTRGYTWHPILNYTLEDVFLSHKRHSFQMHEAYHRFGLSRVSCCFCVLAGFDDLTASLKDERNHEAFRQIALIEIESSFSFKPGNFWLADLAPSLLTENERTGLAIAKERAIERQLADKKIPVELLFDKNTGFPAFQANIKQSEQLGMARAEIGRILNLPVRFTTTEEVYNRFAELLVIKEAKEKEAAAKKARKDAKKLDAGEEFEILDEIEQIALFP